MKASEVMLLVEEQPNGCWEWIGTKSKKGYGEASIDGEKWRVHRWMYQKHKGRIPYRMLVCHTCDNPPCCNPEHLFVGTAADNHADARNKGRAVLPPGSDTRGDKHPLSKLTNAQRDEVRAKRAAGQSLRSLGREYGVSNVAIHYICQNEVSGSSERSEENGTPEVA